MHFTPIIIRHQQLLLSSERCIYWVEKNSLILSDAHLGKSGHFRKEGIGIPQTVLEKDLQRLGEQIDFFGARSLIVIGDLFHSRHNREILYFKEWNKKRNFLDIKLITGNHDILGSNMYEQLDVEKFDTPLSVSPFVFRHEYIAEETKDQYQLCGHIHPGIKIKGKGRQALRLPCFYFTDEMGILPAFGGFTGLHVLEPEKQSRVFAIADKRVVEISTDKNPMHPESNT